MGSSGTLAKLLALPMFCIAVALVRILGHALERRGLAPIRLMFRVEGMVLVSDDGNSKRCAAFASGTHAAGCAAAALALVLG
jgi:hypothetical protein